MTQYAVLKEIHDSILATFFVLSAPEAIDACLQYQTNIVKIDNFHRSVKRLFPFIFQKWNEYNQPPINII